jgi:hypothetical protein
LQKVEQIPISDNVFKNKCLPISILYLFFFFHPHRFVFLFSGIPSSQLDMNSDANDKLSKSSNDLEIAQQQTGSEVLSAPQKNLVSGFFAGVGGDNDVRRSHIARHLVVNGRERTAKNKTTQQETQQQDESQDEQDESSTSKNVGDVICHKIAQQACADVVIGTMRASAVVESTIGNVVIWSSTNEDIIDDVHVSYKNKE